MTYRPAPIDTSPFALPAALDGLLETLAENTHDNWALRRLADGWTPGPARDDSLKQDPNLVPYRALTEAEKQVDRLTTSETLKALLALGYRIETADSTGDASS